MRSADLQRYRKMLLVKRKEVLSIHCDLRSKIQTVSVTEGDLVDHANADAEAELQVRLRETDGKLLQAIGEALVRIRRGTYGVCAACQQPISAARLKAVPWTHRCVKCKEQRA